MKTIILINDGAMQLVLTPENKFEENIVGIFDPDRTEVKTRIYRGSFYRCTGGWDRQSEDSEDNSLIITFVIDQK